MLKRTKDRWTLVPALVGIVSLLAVPLAAADDHQMEMTGEIVKVDVKTDRLTVRMMDAEAGEVQQSDEYTAERKKLAGKEVTLVMGEDTKIMEDGGRMIALADLEPGERVNVIYEMRDGEMKAVGVERTTG